MMFMQRSVPCSERLLICRVLVPWGWRPSLDRSQNRHKQFDKEFDKYVQNMCKSQMHLIYILCIVHHVIKRSACVSFVSVALCRRLSVQSLAFHVFSRRLQLFKQRHHLVASQVRATILYVKAPACPVCLGEEMNSVREKSLHHRPFAMWNDVKDVFWFTRPW